MLALTAAALSAVRQVLTEADVLRGGLRIAIEPKGCAGFGYRLALEEAPADGDEIVSLGDVRVFVDAASRPLLEGAVVDFIDGVAGAGFVFENPNAQAKCACGKSFC